MMLGFPRVSRAKEGMSLMSMQKTLFDMREKIDFMLQWVVMGLGLLKHGVG